jgi:hypothetical protein
VHAGEEARRRSEGAALFVEDLSTGICAMLSILGQPATDARALHARSVERTFGSEIGRTLSSEQTRAGAVDALVTRGVVPGDPPMERRVLTAASANGSFELQVWGCESNVRANAATVDDVLAALEISAEPFPKRYRTEESLRDERLGYVLRRPGPEWKWRNVTMAGLDAIGSSAGWTHDGASLVLIASCPPSPPPIDVQARMCRELLARELSVDFSGDATSSDTDFRGWPCTESVWTSDGERVHMLAIARGNCRYFLFVTGPQSALEVAVAKECLSLLP